MVVRTPSSYHEKQKYSLRKEGKQYSLSLWLVNIKQYFKLCRYLKAEKV